MSCLDLAFTGSGSVLVPLLLGVAFVVVGAVVTLRRRRHRAIVAGALMLIACLALPLAGPASPAQAAGCNDTPDNSLTIRQTSAMTAMIPGRSPASIGGTVTNNGSDETDIIAIVVSIAGVTKSGGAVAGTCGAEDFIVLDSRMPVGQTLAPGATTTFSGASIGLRNGPTNQDACKGSTVHLLYTTST